MKLSNDNPPSPAVCEGGRVVTWRFKGTYFENCPCDAQNVLSKIWAFLLISRAEFMVMGIPVIAIPALLAASHPNDLMGDGAVRLGLITAVWYLAYCISSQVNCLADYELDKTYKSRLPRSIDILKGPRTIWLMIAVAPFPATAPNLSVPSCGCSHTRDCPGAAPWPRRMV